MKERLKNLYQNGDLSANSLLSAVIKGWITIDDMAEIIGEDSAENNAVEIIRNAKIAEISAACNAAIVAGFDLELSEGVVHFNLDIEDQNNIANLFRVIELGGLEFPYQADGGICRIYSAAEIAQIYAAAQMLITTQITYHNTLKTYVRSLETADDIAAITYGVELPAEYAEEMNHKLVVAREQMDVITARVGS